MTNKTALSFQPMHFEQLPDGSWKQGSQSIMAFQHLSRVVSPIEKEYWEEMRRILQEGGRIMTINPKADSGNVVKVHSLRIASKP